MAATIEEREKKRRHTLIISLVAITVCVILCGFVAVSGVFSRHEIKDDIVVLYHHYNVSHAVFDDGFVILSDGTRYDFDYSENRRGEERIEDRVLADIRSGLLLPVEDLDYSSVVRYVESHYGLLKAASEHRTERFRGTDMGSISLCVNFDGAVKSVTSDGSWRGRTLDPILNMTVNRLARMIQGISEKTE